MYCFIILIMAGEEPAVNIRFSGLIFKESLNDP